jgi:hypothetical protein
MNKCTYNYNGKEAELVDLDINIYPQETQEDVIMSKIEESEVFNDEDIKAISMLDSQIFMSYLTITGETQTA